uniref:Tubulin-specific chaperone E n=2 Tax=Parascaris univalens TaxID=6257 RepID=A0A915B2A7_PARUN
RLTLEELRTERYVDCILERMCPIEVGDRVAVGYDRGTVRYVGPVDGYSGEWIGIDWDDAKRGKHNGTVNGRVYFHARDKTSGSMVRAANVDTGRTIIEEMESKYAQDGQMEEQLIGARTVEMIAMEKIRKKQKNLWKLGCIVLDSKLVSKPPRPDCPPFDKCTELNLYNNLIAKWSDLLAILDFFPSLRYLNIRRNVMEPRMESVPDANRIIKSPIFHVVLSECQIDQETAARVMKVFPHVEELYMTCNGLECFDPGAHGLNLTLLDLEANPINDFSNLHNLSVLPRLASLNLTECGLTNIRLPDPAGFPDLQLLNIRYNEIHDWDSVSELARLPSLQRLFYKGNWEVEPEFGLDVREVLIAKLPQLVDLERSDISAVERRSAELRFLNKYGVAPIRPQHLIDIERLKKIYGEPDIVRPTMNLGLDLLKVNVSLNDKTVECSLLASTTIRRLKTIIGRLFRVNSAKISLAAECGVERFRIEMDNALRSLSFYTLSDGDTIVVTLSE